MEHNREKEIKIIVAMLSRTPLSETEAYAVNKSLETIELDLIELKKLTDKE